MSEQRDDTTDEGAPSPGSAPQPRPSYYYDDATGYEVYDPSKDDEEDDDDEAKETQAGRQGVSGISLVTTPFSSVARPRAALACAGEWFAA
ncbi:MAG: hypothetical protein H0W99_05045 [Acidobacteria bacterium]|nr:hypothetical protein [Acidobacteriota bacterium]